MWSLLLSLFLQSIEELLEFIDSILKIIFDAHGWLFLPVLPSVTLLGGVAGLLKESRDKGEWSTFSSCRFK